MPVIPAALRARKPKASFFIETESQHPMMRDALDNYPMQGKYSRYLLATFFTVGGLLHFLFPAAYAAIMPPWLPWHGQLVFVSGVLEIAGGCAVLAPPTRRWAGWGLILLSLAVLPANVQMLLDAHAASESWAWQALLAIRLPLQFLLIFWIWRATQPRHALHLP